MSESPVVPRRRVPELTRREAIQILRLVDSSLPQLIDMRDSLSAMLNPAQERNPPAVFVTGMCTLIQCKLIEHVNDIQEIIVNAAPREEALDAD
jgi:hypothetical protein